MENRCLKAQLVISFFAVLLWMACLVSCGNKPIIPESLKDVKHYVALLDSTVTSMYGWEPRDSTYNTSVDIMVADMIDQYKENHPDAEIGERKEHAIEQQSYDDARVTWAKFKKLCEADEYEKALDYYLSRDPETDKKIEGDFLVFLKHSNLRFVFFSSVLKPLLYEYRDLDFATNEYISVLKLEKALEDETIAMSAETSSYVPEVYPWVIQDLGEALVSIGRLDEAVEMFEDYVHAINDLTGDSLYANLCGTTFITNLYIQDGKPDWALGSWENFKEFLDKNKDFYDPDALEECLERIEEEMSKLSE